MDTVVQTLWETAQGMGLTGTWQFWVVIVGLFLLVVGWKLMPKKPPTPDPLNHPEEGAPAIPMQGGEPGNAGSIPLDQKPPDSYS